MPVKQEPLDTRIKVVTPENVAFEYRIAGPFRRLSAYMLDCLIRALILACIGVILIFGMSVLSVGVSAGIVMVSWHLLDWFYAGLLETFWNGQTVGKRIMRLRVLSIDGQPINGRQAILRNLLRALDCMPLVVIPPANQVGLPLIVPTYLFGGLVAMWSNRFQRAGDLAAGTMVVVEEAQWRVGIVRVSDPEALRLAAFVPPDFEMSRSLGRALSYYMDRRQRFGVSRRNEIARHVGEPLRQRFNLPTATSYDLLLCAVYYRAFIDDQQERRPGAAGSRVPPPSQIGAPDVRFDNVPAHLFAQAGRGR